MEATNMTDLKNLGLWSSVTTYLSQFEEELPLWLTNYKPRDSVSFKDVMSSRVGYYPGSGFDGTLMRVGNKSRSVHSFLYADYGVSKNEWFCHLAQPNNIRGYHSIGRVEWSKSDILPGGRHSPNVFKEPLLHCGPDTFVLKNEKPYCFTEIMERNDDRDSTWGARRFCITFLFADGIDSYYQIFCKEYGKAPWIVLLQDHGLGGNYDRFGKGGILDAIIEKNGVRPEFVLCDDLSTDIWDGYGKIAGLNTDLGGMHRKSRKLFRNIKNATSEKRKMKYSGKINLSDYKFWYLDTILGYNVFIPYSYICHFDFLKVECPVWICTEPNGECSVYECYTDDQDVTYENIVEIIRTFPKRNGYYCLPVPAESIYSLSKDDKVIFSIACKDENEQTKAAIVVCEDSDLTQKEGIPYGQIVYLQNDDNKAMHKLFDFLFREYYINKHRSLVIYYKAQNDIEEENAKMRLGKIDDGVYGFQFE